MSGRPNSAQKQSGTTLVRRGSFRIMPVQENHATQRDNAPF